MFWSWFLNLYAGEERLIAVLLIAVGALFFAAALAYFLQTAGVFTALFAIVFGSVGILIVFEEVELKTGIVGVALLSMLGGMLYLLLFGVLTLKKTIVARKRRRAEIARRLCYTLPDRENTYVRARLNTALQISESDVNEDMGSLFDEKSSMKLEHARTLLSKIKEAPLSQAERLQAEELGKTFALYLHKEKWTPTDLRAVNEICGMLLKLSAKYAV